MKHSKVKISTGILALLMLAACGGGGGGESGGGQPQPVTTVTYTLQLTDISLADMRDGASVDPGGLPITGARATRNQ